MRWPARARRAAASCRTRPDGNSGLSTSRPSTARWRERGLPRPAVFPATPPRSSAPTATSETIAIDVLSDANVVVKWFRAEGEGEAKVAAARALLGAHRAGRVRLWVLDLTSYEVGNVFLRRHRHSAAEAMEILEGLAGVCTVMVPEASERGEAASLSDRHRLTFYDAMYAAVARSRDAHLATFDEALLRPGLGRTPDGILALVEG